MYLRTLTMFCQSHQALPGSLWTPSLGSLGPDGPPTPTSAPSYPAGTRPPCMERDVTTYTQAHIGSYTQGQPGLRPLEEAAWPCVLCSCHPSHLRWGPCAGAVV